MISWYSCIISVLEMHHVERKLYYNYIFMYVEEIM